MFSDTRKIEDNSHSVRVSSAQITSTWENPNHTLTRVEPFIQHAADCGAKLICFPEQFATGWDPQPHKNIQDIHGTIISTLQGYAKKYRIGIIGSQREKHDPLPKNKPGWIISPRTKYALMKMRDGVGNFYFMEEMRGDKLLGYPFVVTNQVPSNLVSTGVNAESVIYFGDFNDAVIAEVSDLILDVSTEAAYIDENGNLVSAFAMDQTVIRAIARHDFGVRRMESFAKLDTVKWGATA